MITLTPEQAKAVPFVRAEVAKGGEMFFKAPVGSGNTIVLLEALRHLPRVAYLSRHQEMREQTKRIAEKMGVDNITIVEPRTGLVGEFEAVIACETMRDVKMKHPCVIRFE